MTDAELETAKALAERLYAEADAIEEAYKAVRHRWWLLQERIDNELFNRRVREEALRLSVVATKEQP